jgi:hypothetical protein
MFFVVARRARHCRQQSRDQAVFTKVNDQVVLVDPTKMRVIAVIGPKADE